MNLKKLLTYAGIGLVVFFLVTQPTQSASMVNNGLGNLRTAAEAIITFVKTIFV